MMEPYNLRFDVRRGMLRAQTTLCTYQHTIQVTWAKITGQIQRMRYNDSTAWCGKPANVEGKGWIHETLLFNNHIFLEPE